MKMLVVGTGVIGTVYGAPHRGCGEQGLGAAARAKDQ